MIVFKIKLAVFDLDGTLIEPTSSWKYLHKKIGTWNDAMKHSELYYSGCLSWNDWAALDAKLWKGIPVKRVEIIAERCPLINGANKTIKNIKKNGIDVAIISGGLSFFAERVANEFGITHVYSNKLLSDGGILTGQVEVNVSSTNKDEILNQLLKDLKLKTSQVVAIGDDFTMIPLFKIVGFSIAFNATDITVKESANVVVMSRSLTDILPHIILAH